MDNTEEQYPECKFFQRLNQRLPFFLIYKASINNLSELKLLNRASQIPFLILLYLTLLTLMKLHLPHIVHFLDSK